MYTIKLSLFLIFGTKKLNFFVKFKSVYELRIIGTYAVSSYLVKLKSLKHEVY